ncbi:hypothetical protein N7468_002490 [Penicillium chermesinum]|uniref:Phosphoglycerate mutase n=1 Tax=Penicillium chermesinum TaxID=63820 RepID=A0A9W9TY10_9EURO|nr:uncharacterized protein N7468_002490 [Penicillium chermesinum]KAJ5247507.1 hypothetical protein N7468_002490 [Penicillium chermesinum]KAJ6145745.1 hypothetical protein N7470_009640 [Penicillium chermesinum]
MRLYLIRHAETVHNVAHVWAGVTDSALTNHGVLQIESVAQYFASNGVHFGQIFSSDLTRTRLTAEGINRLQPRRAPLLMTPKLREKDFGSKEGQRIQSATMRQDVLGASSIKPEKGSSYTSAEAESVQSMTTRAMSFLTDEIWPLLSDTANSDMNVAIVSHGVFMRVLWGCLVDSLKPGEVRFSTGNAARDGLPVGVFTPIWSNTGFMSFAIQPSTIAPAPTPETDSLVPSGWIITIEAVDMKDHLAGLQRTRGGIGSAKHDAQQKRLDQFFKKK